MDKALAGITVLDLSRILAGPYATMLLGDMGARVIKVEQPGRGDDTRHWGPPFTANGESAYFFCANRNKESIAINLKTRRGCEIVRHFATQVDVVVENFRVGYLAGLGLDYLSLRELNSGLIFCSITGYGQTGPYRFRPGYDVVVEAQGGLMSITGPPDSAAEDGMPYKVGVAIVDISAGLHAVIAILAALHHRNGTGEGQLIDIALFDTQLSWLANVASSYLVSGQMPQRYGNAHPSIVPYQTLPTEDGWLMVAVGNDQQFRRLCLALERPEWADDDRFTANRDRVANRTLLVPLLEQEFRRKSSNTWSTLLLQHGIPCSPVQDIRSALSDPQALARGMVQSVDHPTSGSIPQLGPVPKMSATPPAIHSPPPLLGEHTEVLLEEFLDYNHDKVARLHNDGVV